MLQLDALGVAPSIESSSGDLVQHLILQLFDLLLAFRDLGKVSYKAVKQRPFFFTPVQSFCTILLSFLSALFYSRKRSGGYVRVCLSLYTCLKTAVRYEGERG